MKLPFVLMWLMLPAMADSAVSFIDLAGEPERQVVVDRHLT